MLKLFYSTSSAGGFFSPSAHNQTAGAHPMCRPLFYCAASRGGRGLRSVSVKARRRAGQSGMYRVISP